MEIHLKKQPTLVLMAGLSGTGKTTLARAVGRELQWSIFHKDHFKYSFLKRGVNKEAAGYFAYELLFDLAYDQVCEQQLSVILDSAALHPFIVARAVEITLLAGARLKVIFCVAEQEIREQRVQERHSLIPSTSPIAFDPTLSEDDPRRFAHLPSDKLTIYTGQPLEEYLRVAIRYVESDEGKGSDAESSQ